MFASVTVTIFFLRAIFSHLTVESTFVVIQYVNELDKLDLRICAHLKVEYYHIFPKLKIPRMIVSIASLDLLSCVHVER